MPGRHFERPVLLQPDVQQPGLDPVRRHGERSRQRTGEDRTLRRCCRLGRGRVRRCRRRRGFRCRRLVTCSGGGCRSGSWGCGRLGGLGRVGSLRKFSRRRRPVTRSRRFLGRNIACRNSEGGLPAGCRGVRCTPTAGDEQQRDRRRNQQAAPAVPNRACHG